MTFQDFESPSIYELYTSAKKLLSLQDRMENRQLRKHNYKAQQSHISSSGDNVNVSNNVNLSQYKDIQPSGRNGSNASVSSNGNLFDGSNALDLLSPLSVEYADKSGFNVGSANSRKPTFQAFTDITPSSMNDYSPPTSSSSNANKSFEMKIKKEPTTTISPIQIGSLTPKPTPNFNENYSPSTNTHNSSTISNTINNNNTHNTHNSFEVGSISRGSIPVSGSIITENNTNIIPNNNNNSIRRRSVMKSAAPKSNLTSSLSQQQLGSNKPTECYNCHTLKTPLWRKDSDSNTLCNACGLFLKLHGTTRPLSLKTDVIKKRSSRKVGSNKLSNSLPNSLSSPSPNGNFFGSSNKQSYYSNSNLSSPDEDPNTPGSNSSTPSSMSYGNTRPRNVLILPKPTNRDSKSIPIPNRNPNSIPNSPASPFTVGSNNNTPNTNNDSYNLPEYPQSFKRKKSDLNISRKASATSLNSFTNPSSFNTRKIVNSIPKRNSFITNSSLTGPTTINQSFKSASFFDKPTSQLQQQLHSQRNSISQSPNSNIMNNSTKNIESTSITSQSSYNSHRQNSFVTGSPMAVGDYPSQFNKPFLNQDNLPQDLDWLKFEI